MFIAGEIYIGEPSPHHYYAKTEFPHFIVRNEKSLRVEGIYDQGLLKQIIQELEQHLQKAAQQ